MHYFKGTLGNLRIAPIYDLAIRLEELVSKRQKEACERLVDEIEKAFS